MIRTIFAEYNPHRNSIDVYTSAGYMLRIDCWEAEKNLKTIAENSSFASFNTDVGIRYNILRPNRIEVPILDDEAATYYYCICLKDSYIGNALIHKLQLQYQE